MIFPENLQKNDTILLISTARSVRIEYLDCAIATFQTWGLKVEFGKNLFEICNQFAGTDAQRAEDLQWALDHQYARAIICVRGGYGTARLIDKVDFAGFAANPKWVVGFSDYTVLHAHIQNLNIASIHAVMPLFFANPAAKASVDSLQKCLFEGIQSLDNYQTTPHYLNIKGSICGTVVGGNLSILHHLLATKSDFDYTNKVLFIEDIDEYLYHIDRIMNQLDRAGKIASLAGIIVGHFTDMKDNAVPFGQSAYEIIHSYASAYTIPTVFGFGAGHDFDNLAIILGKKVTILV